MIGCGSISDVYLPALHAHADAKLICVADVDEEKAAAQAEKYVTNYLDVTKISLSYDSVQRHI